MKKKSTLLFACSFLLTIGLLAVFTFADIFSLPAELTTSSSILSPKPLTIRAGEPAVLEFAIENGKGTPRASLALDSGNRHLILDTLHVPGNLQDVTIDKERQLAFLANSFSGLQIVDIRNPREMKLIGTLKTPGHAWDIVRQKSILYIATASGGLQVVDTSDPLEPNVLAKLMVPKAPLLKLALYNNTLYASCAGAGLVIIDVSSPVKPRFVGKLGGIDDAWGMAISKGQLFLSSNKFELSIFDISDPTRPRLTGRLPLPERAWELELNGNHLYMPIARRGLFTIDISDPGKPRKISTTPFGVNNSTLAMADGQLHMLNREGSLLRLDLSTPSQPKLSQQLNFFFSTRNLTISDQVAYISAGLGGLYSIDLSETGYQAQQHPLKATGSFISLIQDKQHLFIGTKHDGLHIATIQGPDNWPEPIASLDYKKELLAMTRAGSYLYLVTIRDRLPIVDISDPQHPFVAGNISFSEKPREAIAKDDRLYIIDQEKGLIIASLEKPLVPELLGQLPLQNPLRLIIDNKRAYVATSGGQLHTVDITTPDTPRIISTLSIPWPISHFVNFKTIAVKDKRVYLSGGLQGVMIIDLSDEASPEILDTLTLDDETVGISFDGDLVLAGSRDRKLSIFRDKGKGKHELLARIDSLGKANDFIVDDSGYFLANDLSGLTFLTRPQILNLEPIGRKVGPRQRYRIEIPPQSQPGSYNIGLYGEGLIEDYYGAIRVVAREE